MGDERTSLTAFLRFRHRRRIVRAARLLAETTFAQDFRDKIKALDELCEAVDG